MMARHRLSADDAGSCERRWRVLRIVFVLIGVVLSVLTVREVSWYWRMSGQIADSVRVFHMGDTVREYRERNGRLPLESELEALLPRERRVDSHGNPFQYLRVTVDGQEHFAIVATGSDAVRTVDIERLILHEGPARNVRGQFDRDLVSVDGRMVTYAGT